MPRQTLIPTSLYDFSRSPSDCSRHGCSRPANEVLRVSETPSCGHFIEKPNCIPCHSEPMVTHVCTMHYRDQSA